MNKKLLTKIILLLATIFILNLVWEYLAHTLYISFSTLSKPLLILIASLGDVMYISIIFLLISLQNKNLNWINKPDKLDYLVIIILGILLAIFIETKAFILGKWAYTSLMPTIFRIGLSPLLELFVTAILALKLVNLRKYFCVKFIFNIFIFYCS